MNYEGIAEMLRQHTLGGTTATEITTAVAITGNLVGFFEADADFDSVEFRRLTGLYDPRKET